MRNLRSFAAFAMMIVFSGLGAVASAQEPFRINDDQVKTILTRIEDKTDRFRSSMKDALDGSRLDGRHAEDSINSFVKDFERATDRLKSTFDDDDQAVDDVTAVLERAALIDEFLINHRLSPRVQADWGALRSDLD